jgi:hypothetical protein
MSGRRPELVTDNPLPHPTTRPAGTTTMAQNKDSSSPKKKNLDLRFNPASEPPDPNAKRFDFFLIDTGWNTAVSELVHSHLKPLMNLETRDGIYVLSQDQSFQMIKTAPHLIGHDPIILVYDHHAPPDRKSRGFRGFRLNLGLIRKPEQALARLQEFLRFVALNREAGNLERCVRRELYREGFDGMIKILRETSTELI